MEASNWLHANWERINEDTSILCEGFRTNPQIAPAQHTPALDVHLVVQLKAVATIENFCHYADSISRHPFCYGVIKQIPQTNPNHHRLDYEQYNKLWQEILQYGNYDRHFEDHGSELLQKPMDEWAGLISGFITAASV